MAGNVVGHAKIVVDPVAGQFQNKLKKDIEAKLREIKPEVKVLLDLDQHGIDEAKKKIDLLREESLKPINLKIDLDTRDAAQEADDFIEDLRGSRGTVRLDADMREAHGDLNDFYDEWNHKKLILDVEVDLAGAEAQMLAFKAANSHMVTHLVMDWSAADDEARDFAAKMQRYFADSFGNIPKSLVPKSIGPTRGRANIQEEVPNFFLDPELQASNFVNRLIEVMQPQLVNGFNKIYTPYLRLVGDLQNYLSRPIKEMNHAFAESKTLYDALNKSLSVLRGNSNRMTFGLKDAFRNINAQFNQMRANFPSINKSFEVAGDGWSRFANRMKQTPVGQFFGNMSRSVKNFALTTAIDLNLLAKNIATPFKNLSQVFKREMSFKEAFAPLTAGLRSLPGLARNAMAAFNSNFLKGFPMAFREGMGEVMALFRAMPGEVLRITGGLGAMVGRATANGLKVSAVEIGKFFRDLGVNAMDGVRAAGRGFAAFGSDVKRVVSLDLADLRKLNDWFINTAHYATQMARIYAGAFLDSPVGQWVQNQATAFRKLGQVTANGLRTAGNAVKDFGVTIGRHMATIGSAVRSGAARVVAPIGRIFGSVGHVMAEGFRRATPVVMRVFGNIGRNLANSARTTMRVIGGIFSSAGSLVAGLMRLSKPLTRAAGLLMRGLGAAFMKSTAVFTAFKTIFGRMGKYVSAFGQVAIGAFAQIGGVIFQAVMPALMAMAAGLGLIAGQAVLGAVLALAGAFMSVAQGALLVAPAFLAIAGISFMALKIGLKDVKAGVSAAFSKETPEEFEDAISKMPESVKAVARAFREFKGPIDEMKKNLQNNMLEGLAPGIKSAMNNLLPSFKSGLENIGKAWNGAFKNALDELSSDRARRGMEATMEGSQRMADNMQNTLANIIGGFGSLVEQGAKHLGNIGSYFDKASQSFVNWAESLKEIDPSTGMSKFDKAIESAKKNASLLKDILGGILGTLGNILKAANEGGGSTLNGMAEGLQRLREYTSEGNEGFTKMVAFFKESSEMAKELTNLIEPVFNIVLDVVTLLMDFARGAMPGLTSGFEALAKGIEDGVAPLKGLGGYFSEIFEALAPALEKVGAVIAPLIEGIVKGISLMLVPLAKALDPLMAALIPFAKALEPMFETVGKAIGDIFVVLEPIATTFINMLTSAAPLLDKLLYYIGAIAKEIIVAVGPLFMGKDSAMKGLFDALMPVVDILGNQLLRVIRALAPVFPLLGEAIKGIIEAIQPLLPVVGELIEKLGSALVDAINWLMPFMPPLVEIIKVLANIISGVLVFAINMLMDIWDMVWPTIVKILNWAINEVIVPILNFLIGVFKEIANIVLWLANNVFEPLFAFMAAVVSKTADAISWVFERTLKPAFSGLKSFVETIVDGIGKAWSDLKRLMSAPIKWVIETVFNDGLGRGWNFVNEKLGHKLGEWHNIDTSSLQYAKGGTLPGYTPGRDVHKFYSPTGGRLELSGGEAIMVPEWTRMVGGPEAVARMNKEARNGTRPYSGQGDRYYGVTHKGPNFRMATGGTYMPVQSFDGGGVLQGEITTAIQRAMWDSVRTAFPGAIMTSGTRYVDVGSGFDNHMAARAIDLAGPMQQMANWIASTYPDALELFWDPGPNIKNGNPTGAIGGHSDHVHWAMDHIIDPYSGEVVSSEGGSSGPGFFRRMISMFEGAFKPFFEPIKNAIMSRIPDELDPGFAVNTALGAGEKAFDTMWDWAKEQLKNKFMPGSGGGAGDVDLSGISGDVAAQVEEVFARNGWTGQQWEDAKWIISRESQWDPSATNPSSGAFGLFQFNPMGGDTLGQYLPDRSTDPAVQANAGAKYIRDRYGDPTAARRFWEANGWYDQGGMATGIGYLQKAVLQPERVLSPMQTKAFNDFVYGLMPELIRSFARNPLDLKGNFDRAIASIDGFRQQWQSDNRERISEDLMWGFMSREQGIQVVHDLSKVTDAIIDPYNYLAAEKLAKEKQDARRQGEIEQARKERDEALKDKSDAEREAAQEADRAEDERIRQMKESGEYYYGYKTLGEGASNPLAYQPTEQETLVRNTLTAMAEPMGLGGLASKVGKWYDIGRQIEAGAKIAGPAWAAALNGDPSGLAHNIAVSDAALYSQYSKEAIDLIPSMAGGITEMLMASGASRDMQPFIGTVNSGLTQAELFETLSRYDQMRSRQRTGTVRTR